MSTAIIDKIDTSGSDGAGSGHRLVMPAVCLSLATVVSAVTSLNVALPSLARATGASSTQVSWVVDAYALVFASLLLVAGTLGDRYGRRRALLTGLVIFGSASAMAMCTTDIHLLIGFRAMLGVGAALVMPATLSTITTVYSDQQRQRAIGIWSGVSGASAVLGLVVSGTLLEWFSWRAAFGLNIVLAVVGVVLVARAVPESGTGRGQRLDFVGAVLFVLTFGVLVFTVIEAPTVGWTSARTIAGLVTAAVSLAITLAWELRHPAPLLDPRLFTNRLFSAGSLTITIQFAAFFGFVFMMIQYLQLVAGLRPLVAAVCMLPMAAGLMISSRMAFKIAAKIGRNKVGVIGLVLLVAGLVILSTLGGRIDYTILFVGLPILGLGMGLAMTPATTAITEALPQEQQGVASAMNDLSRELGGAIGIAVLGSVLNSTITHRFGTGAGIGAMAHLHGPAAQIAHQTFADGMGNALTLAAAAVFVAAITVAILTRNTNTMAK